MAGVKRKICKYVGASVTLDSAFNEFVAEKTALNLTDISLKNYKDTMRVFRSFHGFTEETTLAEINRQHLLIWVNDMRAREISSHSINHYLSHVRTFFYWAMEREFMDEFKVPLISTREAQLKLFTDEELLLLLEPPQKMADFTEWRTYVIVNWVLATGNRAATICEIQMRDVDFTNREIVLQHTKNRKAQIIPLSPALESVLREYIRMWRRYSKPDDYLFPNVSDEKLTTTSLRQSFYRYCKRRGVERTNMHGLRHNFAKGWVKNNGNMFVLQRVLGHSSLDMTRRYVRLFAEDIKTDYELYSPLDTIKRIDERKHKVKRVNIHL